MRLPRRVLERRRRCRRSPGTPRASSTRVTLDDIAAAVEDVLDDAEPWIERRLARAQGFTWDACARAHDDVYRELCSG